MSTNDHCFKFKNKNSMCEIFNIKCGKDIPFALLKTEINIFSRYQSCPKSKDEQEAIYPYPGKLFFIKEKDIIISFLYSYSVSSNTDYIWACGTISQNRKSGYFSRLLRRYNAELPNGFKIYFVSENNNLRDMFLSFGFNEIDLKKIKIPKNLLQINCRLKNINFSQMIESYYCLKGNIPVNANFYALEKVRNEN